MSDDELLILNFLQDSPETCFARKEIARRAGRRSLFEENPHWIDAPLSALVGQGLVEVTESGLFQIKRRTLPT